MQQTETMNFDDFTVPRHKVARLLKISVEELDKLGLPYTQLGEQGRKRYRQSDIDQIRQSCIKQ